jgi:hypothetical protein
MATTNIAQRTLPVGQSTFGPVSITSSINATLTIDTTVTGGLKSLTAASDLNAQVEGSNDGGNWTLIVGADDEPGEDGDVIWDSASGKHVARVRQKRRKRTKPTANARGGTAR